ncbi:hypothetical protein [uncultured Methanobrevibacter sp.]|uniref:hypothetical protein n=1 Tax=uncultured Methanobrevibacter sp. TaxID=253161 RepID=UPI0025E4212C|nr:hypothetical protein [uncultured Methanobrevibacter sp.]
MRYKKSLIFICLIICLFSVASVCASDVNETTVASENQVIMESQDVDLLEVENQSDDELGVSSGTFTDLANEIDNANDELNLTRNYVYNCTVDSDYKYGIKISKSITINGKGFSINGNNNASGFRINYKNVTLNNISFFNCFSSDEGGAIYCNSYTCILTGCTFVNCSSSEGGAIYWGHYYGLISNCSFVNNSADRGGAIYLYKIKGIIFNCIFTENYAINGGAIFCYSGDNGVVSNSIFKNNSGSAISWRGANGTVFNCKFINNFDKFAGGAIAWSGANGTVFNCSFVNNSVDYNLSDYVYGGAVYWSGSKGVVFNCSFVNNFAKFAGAICWLSDNGFVFNCIFVNNSANYDGGAIYWSYLDHYSSYDRCFNGTIFNCNFVDNTANRSGGGIYCYSDNSSISNCNFTNNSNGILGEGKNNKVIDSLFVNNKKSDIFWIKYVQVINCNYSYVNDKCQIFHKSFINAYFPEMIDFGEILKLKTEVIPNATGNISVYIDDVLINNIPVNEMIDINNLSIGNHSIKVIYNGDNYYASSINESIIKVNKLNLNLSISHIDIAGNTSFYFYLNKDATGNITLMVNNEKYNEKIENGFVLISIYDLFEGKYNVTIKYSGDNYFNSFCKVLTNLNIKSKTNLVIYSENVFIGEIASIDYNLTSGAIGIISIYTNDTFIKNVTVGGEIELEGLKVGNYTIKIIYNGDEYFASCENTTKLTIYKLTPDYYIDDSGAGKNANISLVFDEDATGNVNISFGYWDLDDNNNDVWKGNYNFTGQLINGEVNFTIPNLEGGWIEYIIKYSGDDRYDSLNESDYIWVSYKDSPISIDIPEINWSDNVILKPTLPNGATGNIHLLLDNISLANISLGDGFKYNAINGGKHYLTIEYSGDEYFSYNETTVEFYVNKLNSNFSMESTFDSEKYITIPITLNGDANGVITVNINDNIFSGDVVNGSFNFTVTDLGAGTHNAIINYTGDDKYNDIYIAKEITVNLKNFNLNLNISNILKDENLLIKPNLAEGATGTVSIYVDGELKRTINVGSSYTLAKPSIGQHKIRLVYSGNTYFTSSEKEFSFRVFTIYPIEAVDTQIVYGTDKKFQAKFYDEYGEILANKYVSFIVNGTEYPIRTNSEGIAVLDVDLDVGEYNVSSVSLLDESTTNKLLIFHSVHAESMIIEYGSDTKFKARFLDETANPLKNTRIVFNVDGKDTMVTTDVDGLAILNTELAMGAHYITSINTITDENMTNKVVIVSDINSIISVEVGDINYGQNASVKVNIDSGYLNADVTIKVTGENGYEQIFTQKAAKTITKEVSGLNASKYRVNVKYADEDLLTIDKNTTFTVSKIDPTITLNVDDAVIGDTATLTINIPQATGGVEIKMGTETYDGQLIDGMIVKELFDFKIGENTIEVFYKGDNNFNPLIKTTAFKAWNNLDLDVAYESEIMVGEDYIIDINNLDENTNEDNLILFIDGVKHNHDFSIMYDDEDTNHIQISFIADLSEGEHIWEITYLDNVNYINTSKSVEFSVIVPPQHDTYQFALITNKSVINIPFDKITWNVKTVSVYDEYLAEYYDDPYVNYTFSTFTLDNIGYVIITSSENPSFASLAVPFNPNGYIEHDGIYYAVKDGEITDVIGYSDYNVYDNEYYRIVGSGYKTFSENAGAVEYALVNGECYKITGTMGASTAMFNRAIQNVDYKIVNGKYYTLNDELIENLLDESYGSDYAVINGTFYDINGNIYTPHAAWTIGDVLINNNGELSKVVYGKDYNNSYAVDDGKLFAVVGDAVGEIVDVDMNQSVENQTSENTTDINETVEPEIDIPSLDNVSEEGNVVVTLPSDATGTVTLTVGGKDYIFDVKDGVVNVKLPELENGNYDYTITYSGDGKYSSFVTNGNVNVNTTKPEDVKPTPQVVIPPLDEPSEDGSVAISLPGDATGTVTLTINGKEYYFAVVKGAANIIIPDLGDGNYPYTITYSGDSKYSSFTTNGTLNKVAPAIDPVITASNVKVTYANGKYYTIKVYGTDGELADGVKVVITVKGKTFKTLTTSNGVARFKVTNVPGTYKMNITALGKSVVKTLTVKHLVTLKSVTVKKSAKKLTLQATLGKVNGKYLKNKKITFKFNGKKYTAKTDKKGVAKVTIKSSILKKLKVGKKVTYQATYSKDTVKKTAIIKK